MSYRDKTLFTFYFTFLTGAFLVSSSGLLLYWAGYFFICFYILLSLNKRDDFFYSFGKFRDLFTSAKVILAGVELPDNTHAVKKEERYEASFERSLYAKRMALTFIIGGVSSWFILYYKGNFPVTSTLMLLILGTLIINSLFIGHLLIPLFILSMMVIFTVSPESDVFVNCSFLFLLFSSLYLMSGKAGFSRESWGRILLLFTAVLVLIYGFSWFFVVKKPELAPEIKKQETLVRNTLKEERERLLKLNQSGLFPERIKINLSAIDALFRDLTRLQSARERKNIADRIEDLLKENRQIEQEVQESLQALPQVEMDKDLLSKIEVEFSKKENGQRRPLPDQIKNNLRSFVSAADGELHQKGRGNLQDTKKLKELLSYDGLLPEEAQELSALVQKLEKELSESRNLQIPPITKEKIQLRKNLLNDLKKKEETSFFKKLKKHLPLLALLALFLLYQYFFRKKGIRRFEAPDPDVLPELRKEWARVKKLKLSPREEVILYYNLFHESMQKIHYADHEAPPSCIIRDDLNEFNPAMSLNGRIITETFTGCFYGAQNITQQSLKEFRLALNKMLRFYRI